MTQSYSEQRQAILFKASRDMRDVACMILNDVQNDVELTSASTLGWAKKLAAFTANQANELENQGHEQCVADTRRERLQSSSHDKYSAAITAFEARILAVGGTLPA